MKYTHEQIFDALKIIMDICEESECNKGCPFRTFDDECWFKYNDCPPATWLLNTPSRWKAFIDTNY